MADDFRLQEECQALQDLSTYSIDNEHDVRSMDSGEVIALLEGMLKPLTVAAKSVMTPFP